MKIWSSKVNCEIQTSDVLCYENFDPKYSQTLKNSSLVNRRLIDEIVEGNCLSSPKEDLFELIGLQLKHRKGKS